MQDSAKYLWEAATCWLRESSAFMGKLTGSWNRRLNDHWGEAGRVRWGVCGGQCVAGDIVVYCQILLTAYQVFFFFLVWATCPPIGENAVGLNAVLGFSTFYVARFKLYGYRLTPSIMLVKMLMVTKITSNSVRSAVFNSIQQVPPMNSMIPIQHVERVCG